MDERMGATKKDGPPGWRGGEGQQGREWPLQQAADRGAQGFGALAVFAPGQDDAPAGHVAVKVPDNLTAIASCSGGRGRSSSAQAGQHHGACR